MDKGYVEALRDNFQPVFKEIYGLKYSNKGFVPILPPIPSVLEVHSLTAVTDYCKHELIEDRKYIIHVASPEAVNVLSQLSTGGRQRECLISARLAMDVFEFDQYHYVENFIIAMQARFEQDEITAAMLAMVGNITAEAKHETHDDGVTQDITVKRGIQKEGWESVPNPVVLAPFRTFTEVSQPKSKFVFRVKTEGPTCALYDADGGAWKNEAIQNIAGMLHDELSDEVANKRVTILA